MFTQYDAEGKNPKTIRLKSKETIIVEANELPNDIKLAEKAGYVFVKELSENTHNPTYVEQ